MRKYLLFVVLSLVSPQALLAQFPTPQCVGSTARVETALRQLMGELKSHKETNGRTFSKEWLLRRIVFIREENGLLRVYCSYDGEIVANSRKVDINLDQLEAFLKREQE